MSDSRATVAPTDKGGGPIDALRDLVRSDIEENLGRPASLPVVVGALLLSRGVQAAALYRVGHLLHLHGLSVLSEVLLRVSQLLFGVDISYRARIGPGLVLRHPCGIVVGRDVVLGRRVRLFQNVTLGNRIAGSPGRPDGMPVIGDDVHLFAGAVVLGQVDVGSGSTIGANAVLTTSCPAHSRVTAPAPRIRAVQGGSVDAG